MAGWALGEIWVVIACLRMLGGRDVVSLQSNKVELRKEIFGVGASKQYLGQQIWNLRFQPEMGAGRSHRDSGMAFDYGAKTITFASGLDEAEANQLVTLIKQRSNIAETPAPSKSTVRFWQAR
ncbi:MAG TPA: hypothetical protein VNY29_16415 [Terriglobales bacterium]|jgi:hypothetical protein|nr:hypothetical protein [Terriglobales bacterium]